MSCKNIKAFFSLLTLPPPPLHYLCVCVCLLRFRFCYSEKREGGGESRYSGWTSFSVPVARPHHILQHLLQEQIHTINENVIAISYNKRSVYPGKNHSLAADGRQPKSAPIPIRTDLVRGIKNSTERIFAIISLYPFAYRASCHDTYRNGENKKNGWRDLCCLCESISPEETLNFISRQEIKNRIKR
jgi:hypothetical protein